MHRLGFKTFILDDVAVVHGLQRLGLMQRESDVRVEVGDGATLGDVGHAFELFNHFPHLTRLRIVSLKSLDRAGTVSPDEELK